MEKMRAKFANVHNMLFNFNILLIYVMRDNINANEEH
jgi:hypothetical protein